jgi:hypothetical protein
LLSEWALREHGSAFLFVTGFLTVKRPFYTAGCGYSSLACPVPTVTGLDSTSS